MPLFRYQAITALGKSIKGVIDADSLFVAKERLRKSQVLVTEVHPLHSHQNQLTLPAPLLLSFTQELTQLLQAGLPLYESLLTIEEKYRRHKAHPLFLDLADHLKEGSPLSSALKRYPATFDHVYLSMVKVAEQSGQLAAVFCQLSELILRQQKLKKQLVSAFAYPLFLGLFCFCIVLGLLFFVIPSMKELFEDRALHPITALVLGVSQFVNTHATFLALSSATLLVGAVISLRTKKLKIFLYAWALKLPFVKTLLLDSALLRFCRSLAMLLSGGVPLLEALALSRGVVKNPLLEASILSAEKRIGQGERLSGAFRGELLIPSLVIRMLSLSEETGKMEDAFFSLAGIYDGEMEKHLLQLTTFLQPALLIALGVIVGLVVLSILLPLTDVSSFTS